MPVETHMNRIGSAYTLASALGLPEWEVEQMTFGQLPQKSRGVFREIEGAREILSRREDALEAFLKVTEEGPRQ
jgi:hypothetical protein